MLPLTRIAADGWITLAESGALVLTASGRLQRHLHERYARHQAGLGRDVWPTPAILTWAAWLERFGREQLLADEGAGAPAAGLLLSASQEAAVWQEIVQGDPAIAGLLHAGSLAQQAQAAWALAHSWGIDLERLGPARRLSPEVARFLDWSRRYGRRCAEAAWTDGARLPLRLAAALDAGRWPPPGRLVLAGFDGFDPAQERVLAALAERGCAVLELEPPRQAAAAPGTAVETAQLTVLPDDDAEAEAALRWARAQVEAGAAFVGLVVQDLEGRRSALARMAEEILAPGRVLGGAEAGAVGGAAVGARGGSGESELPFHLSLGPALMDVPLVRAALRLLRLDGGWLPLEGLEAALLGPYLGEAEAEREARGRLVTALRRRGDASVRLTTVAGHAAAAGCSGLAGRLHRVADALGKAPRRQSHGAWARHATEMLRAWGWPGHKSTDSPGGRTLSSAEYQAYERWGDLLDEWCALDAVLAPEGRGAALARLERLAEQARFAPQAHPAPVQILGHLEAAGLEFDAVWALGFDDEAWPRPPAPNPLLPLAEQRARGVPRASAERELAFAESVTERLRNCAPRAVFSHAAQRGTARLRPSPLVADLPAVAPAALGGWSHPGLWDTIAGGARLELRVEEPLRHLPPGTAVAHGTGVFSAMAACPFRAQALHRWNAQEFPLPEPGLSPMDHGILLHAVLQKLWAELRDWDTLAALDEGAVVERVERAVGLALAEFRHERLRPELSRLEGERLRRLALGLLALDRARPPFAVTAAEAPVTAQVGGVAVTLRMDRMDTLADGARLLLDYKSGAIRIGEWLSERPDAPQLPLYAVTQDPPPIGLALVQVRVDSIAYAGVAGRDVEIPGVRPLDEWKAALADGLGATWPAALARWRQVLEELGARFRSGDAAVDPKARSTCDRCPLPALCRIDERGPLARDGSGEGGDSRLGDAGSLDPLAGGGDGP